MIAAKAGVFVLILMTLYGETRGIRNKRLTGQRGKTIAPPRWLNRRPNVTNVDEAAGNTVRFPCRADGEPTPTITWFKNGKPIEKNDRVGLYRMRSRGRLVIETVLPTDNGIYSCTATNRFGSLQRIFKLHVQERLALRPSILAANNQTASVGDNATLECKIYVDSNAHFQWRRFKNGSRIIVQGQRKTISQLSDGGGTILRLEIQSVTVDDEGGYTCLAANVRGIAHKTIWLDVRQAPPRWLNRRPNETNLLQAAGKSARFSCPAVGEPTPTITWFKDGEPIKKSVRYRMKSRGALAIESVVPADSGIYSCTATNRFGSLQRIFKLHVRERFALGPSIIAANNRTALVGENATLECKFSGDSNANFRWMRIQNGSRIIVQGPRKTISQLSDGVDTIHRLEIQSVTVDDEGGYTCLAENAFGLADKTIWLDVEPADHDLSNEAFTLRLLEKMNRLPPVKRREFRIQVSAILEKFFDDQQ